MTRLGLIFMLTLAFVAFGSARPKKGGFDLSKIKMKLPSFDFGQIKGKIKGKIPNFDIGQIKNKFKGKIPNFDIGQIKNKFKGKIPNFDFGQIKNKIKGKIPSFDFSKIKSKIPDFSKITSKFTSKFAKFMKGWRICQIVKLPILQIANFYQLCFKCCDVDFLLCSNVWCWKKREDCLKNTGSANIKCDFCEKTFFWCLFQPSILRAISWVQSIRFSRNILIVHSRFH